MGFIDGSIKKPEKGEYLQPKVRCNDLINAWILNAYSPNIKANSIFWKDACLLWDNLKQKYSIANGLILAQIRRQIAPCTQDEDSKSTFYKLQGLYNEDDANQNFYACKDVNCIAKENSERAVTFFFELNDSYMNIRGQILKKKKSHLLS